MPNQTRHIHALRALPLLLVLACFPAGVTDAARNAASMSVSATPAPTAPVATLASPAPSVIVKNNAGHPVQGVPVTFSVTSGGGSITGATVQTDKDGIARVGSWTYGTLVGSNQLTAKAGPATPVVFNVTTTAGAAAQATKINDGQSAEIGKQLPQPVAVVAKDAYGNVVAGVSVSFKPSAGSVSPTTAQTDANGRAQTVWTMGTTPGAEALDAVIANLPAVAFAATATPAPPATVTKTNDGQNGVVGSVLPNPVTVTVKDSYGNPVSGVTVQLVASGNGSVNPASPMTDASGQASAQWTLPTTVGSATVTATAGNLPPVTFNATARAGDPARLTASSYPDSGTVNTAAGDSVRVYVTDSYGNALSGVSVAFSGNGTASPTPALTQNNGVAAARWVLPKTAGPASLTATVGSMTATFNVTAVAGPAWTMAITGTDQSGTVGTTLRDSVAVVVKDEYGNLVRPQYVRFATASASGTVAPDSVLTNAGFASARWTLPTIADTAYLTASAGSANATFRAFANPDVPAVLIKGSVNGDGQTGPAGSTLPQQISVVVRDKYQNALSNVQVSFAPNGGTASPASMATRLDGSASSSWTLPSTAGSYSMSVSLPSAPGVAPLTFTATATAVNTDPCAVKGTVTLGGSVSGDLSTSGCAFGPSKKIDLWALNLNGSTPVDVRLQASNPLSYDTYMTMYRGSYSGQTGVIAENDDNNYYDAGSNSGFHVLGGTGQFLVGATQYAGAGPYQLSVSSWNGSLDGSVLDYYAVSGTNTTQRLESSDFRLGTRWSDRVMIYLKAGETITVGMSSTDFDTYLELQGNVGGVITRVASDDNGGGGTNSRMVFTASTSDIYFLWASAAHDNSGGAYNLTIDVSAPAAVSARTSTTTSTTALPASGTYQRKVMDALNQGIKLTTP